MAAQHAALREQLDHIHFLNPGHPFYTKIDIARILRR